jgi:hypothetical protein
MQFSDSPDAWRKECPKVFDHARSAGNVVVTGTEASDSGNASILGAAADDAGFWKFIHADGEWVAVDKSVASVNDHGYIPVIPGQSGSASSGGHSPRGIVWVTFTFKSGGPKVSVGVCHFLTQQSMDAQGATNKPLQDAALNFCADKGSGGNLAFINGDVNMNDETKNVWGTSKIVTCWDELRKWPATHEGSPGTIDVISRYDPDGGTFTKGAVIGDDTVNLATDHRLIQATRVP